MSDIEPHNRIWFPAEELYRGREGDYARPAHEFTEEQLVELVQQRAKEDGEWAIENHLVGEHEELMRKMMEWVSDPKNITQCYQANLDKGPTVDWVCHDLANATKYLFGSRG